ncbi:hypothetical protein HanPI659440_Chr09g0315921 [Helianthus annuus]|nr:hypothetical protein HanPI659440_Chr09g0315921 [Helianthus annuus]
MTDNSGSSEVIAFDLAHQVVIDVRLPRHVMAKISENFAVKFLCMFVEDLQLKMMGLVDI